MRPEVRMKKLVTLMLGMVALSGCTTILTLYPVKGPLTVQKPGSTLVLTSTYKMASVTLEDGEVCSGPWVSRTPKEISAAELAPEWDAIYGSGYFASKLLGTAIPSASLVGNRGTTMQVEMRYFAAVPPNPGVAIDSRGNLYKLSY